MGKIFIWFGDEARICMRLYTAMIVKIRETRHFITLKFKLQVLILLLNQINQLLTKIYRVKLSMHFLTMFIYVLCCDFQLPGSVHISISVPSIVGLITSTSDNGTLHLCLNLACPLIPGRLAGHYMRGKCGFITTITVDESLSLLN